MKVPTVVRTVEPAAPSHVPMIDAMRRACIAYMRQAGIDQWDEAYPTPQILHRDCTEGNLFVLTDAEEQVIGSVTLDEQQSPEYASVPWAFSAAPVGVIHRLMIQPEQQGKGLAKIVMHGAEKEAQRRGHRSIRLDAFLNNPAALRLYETLGYQRVGQVQFRKGAFACFEKRLSSHLEALGSNHIMSLPLDFKILTHRCRLRCVSEADIPQVFSATRYPGFNDGMTWDAPINMDELREPLRKNVEAWMAGTAYCFTIESKADGTLLGRIALRKDKEPGVWNIGFWTHPEHQGKGYMSEAAMAVVDWGFRQLGAVRIEACHALWNVKSERVLKKLGMQFLRYIPEGFQKRGQWVEENLLAVDRAAWEASARL